MKLHCWYCHKAVTTELPEKALFRAIAVCPECIKDSDEAQMHPLAADLNERITERATNLLMAMVDSCCLMQDGQYDSMANSTYADALLFLAEYGHVRITGRVGDRVFAAKIDRRAS